MRLFLFVAKSSRRADGIISRIHLGDEERIQWKLKG
jgi:hypothetical protein